MASYDSLIIGEIAEDTNIDYDGTEVHAIGGAVYYSGFAAANIGHKIAVLPKADTARIDLKAAFSKAPNITVYPVHSPVLLCHQERLPHGGSGAPYLHGGQRH